MRPTESFDSDLASLRARLSEMGGLAEEQLAGAIDIVRRRDLALAQRVVEADKALDACEEQVEEIALRMLALRQPLAKELRETIAALRIASALERVGDLAKNIARRAESLSDRARPPAESSILRMGKLAQSQLADALDAFGARDNDAAMDVWRRDVEIDELYNSVFYDLVTQMTYEPRQVSQGAQLMFIAKNIERVGDHTTFISEMTHFVTVGRSIERERPKGAAEFPMIDPEPGDSAVASKPPRRGAHDPGE
ncbi:MAG: phosphate signaling complex protein PhoU [Pseudomonadota bacterium]